MRIFLMFTFMACFLGLSSCEKEELVVSEEMAAEDISTFYEEALFVIENMGQGESFELISQGTDMDPLFNFDASGTQKAIGATGPVGPDGPTFKPRCEGDGIKFIKCVKKAVDEHGCQKVTASEGGGYESNDCP